MLYEKTTVAPWTMAILKKLQSLSWFSQFALWWWTNLALRFWHRISIDLDFFSTTEFNEEKLHQEMISVFPDCIQLAQKWQTLNYSIENVKIDILYFPYPYIEDIETIDWIKLISTPDVIAMKLSALQKRTTKKDYFDVYEILEHYSMDNLIGFYTDKFKNSDPGHIIHMLYMSSEADNDFDPQMLKKTNRTMVKETIKQKVNQFIESQL